MKQLYDTYRLQEEAVAQNDVLQTEQVNQVAAVKKDLQSKMSHLCDENVSSQLFVTSHYT